MSERLLQFIWQFQYYNGGELETASGEKLVVISAGLHNTNQGPDFINARIRIGNTTWAGMVELHIKTSHWHKHHHQHDPNYNNVILHVVWENDLAPAENGHSHPVLELKSRVPRLLLKRYGELMDSSAFIPCQRNIHSIHDITWKSWKERLLAERLLRKAKLAETCLLQNKSHWEETFWWLLARNFGMKVNGDAFESLARSLPLNLLARQKHQLLLIEALLFGQAGLLDRKFEENYPKLLQKEYVFLRKKYGIRPIQTPFHFLRMRPGNFPTIRLAQLAVLIHCSVHLFSRIRESRSLAELRKWFDITANDYWHYHYRFDEPSSFKQKRLGKAMTDSIIINTVAPMLFAYGMNRNEQCYKDKALQWLEETGSESNVITRGFQQMGIESKNAYDSQALIELKNEYCNRKRCLECAVGNAILRNGR